MMRWKQPCRFEWKQGKKRSRSLDRDVIWKVEDIKDAIVECVDCSGKKICVTHVHCHRLWHTRINTLLGIRRAAQKVGAPILEFGPESESEVLILGLDSNAMLLPLTEKKQSFWDYIRCLRKTKHVARIGYIEGQKYTFGQNFISRKEQGEFVFLNDVAPSCRSLENYFELETRAGGLWIKTVQKQGAANKDESTKDELKIKTKPRRNHVSVAVNGKELRTASCTKLSFGDVITVEVSCRNFCDLVVQEVGIPGSGSNGITAMEERDKNEDGQDQEAATISPDTIACNNGLIVRNIFNYLSAYDIKNCRLVSPLWREEGLSFLRQRTVVRIDMSNMNTMRLFNLVRDMEKYLMTSWVISLSSALNLPNDECKATKLVASVRRKFSADLEWLISPNSGIMSHPHPHHNIQKVQLFVEVDTKDTWQILLTILKGVSNTLMELDLEVKIPVSSKFINSASYLLRNLKLSVEMKKMKQLTLRSCSGISQQVVKSLLPKFSQVQSLNLPTFRDSVGHAAVVLKSLSNSIILEPSSFRYLNTISIPSPRREVLEALTAFPSQRIKRLHLGEYVRIGESPPPENSQFEFILENQALSLEELEISFLVKGELPSFNFPIGMPILKKLKLLITISPGPPSFLEFPSLDAVTFGRSSVIDYRSGYPALSHLKVAPLVDDYSWEQFHPIVSLFLPTQASLTCTQVEVPFLMNRRYHPCLNTLEATFPNARFPPELRSARAGPVYNEDEDEEENRRDSDAEDEEQDWLIDFD